jgi:hypothetical protein
VRKIFCSIGIHLHLTYLIKWVDYPGGKLGYWFCPTCFTPFMGHVHKLNSHGEPSAYRIKNLNQEEVKSFLKQTKGKQF